MVSYIKKRGSALIIAMICIIMLTAMVGAMIQVSSSNFQYQLSEISRLKGDYLTGEGVERYRRELISNFQNSGMGPSFFVNKLRDLLDGKDTDPQYHFENSVQSYKIKEYAENAQQANEAKDSLVTSWISDVSEKDSKAGQWVELTSEATVNSITVQTTIRLSFAPRLYTNWQC